MRDDLDDQSSADDGDDDDDYAEMTHMLMTMMILPLLRKQKMMTNVENLNIIVVTAGETAIVQHNASMFSMVFQEVCCNFFCGSC